MNDAVRIPGHSGKWVELWEVVSASRSNVSYVVGKDRQGRWGCSCPAWIFHTPRRDCKHIRHVAAQVARNVQARTMTPAEVESKPAIKKALSRFSLIEV
jgi:predicted nucleic acid-binding Zn finger protein